MNNLHFIQCRFAARYFSHSPPVFQRLFFTTEESSAVQYGPRRMKLRDLMAATLRFLHNDCATYRVLWDWSPCVSQLLTSDIMVRGYAPAARARRIISCHFHFSECEQGSRCKMKPSPNSVDLQMIRSLCGLTQIIFSCITTGPCLL